MDVSSAEKSFILGLVKTQPADGLHAVKNNLIFGLLFLSGTAVGVVLGLLVGLATAHR
jgi:hypothetical protein